MNNQLIKGETTGKIRKHLETNEIKKKIPKHGMQTKVVLYYREVYSNIYLKKKEGFQIITSLYTSRNSNRKKN